jgi:hypothetical protein
MKKLLLSVSVILFATGAFAQTKTSGSEARFGLKAGVNLATFHYSGNDVAYLNDLTKSNVGFNLTAFADFGVSSNFFIQPAISLQNKGTKLQGYFPIGSTSISGTNKTNLMAIEIPINAVYSITAGNGAIQISAGPYIGFNISGKAKTSVTSGANQNDNEEDLKFGNEQSDNLTSTDFGANFGLAYKLSSGFQVGTNYGLGLTNIVPKANRGNNNKATNRVISLTVGYSF